MSWGEVDLAWARLSELHFRAVGCRLRRELEEIHGEYEENLQHLIYVYGNCSGGRKFLQQLARFRRSWVQRAGIPAEVGPALQRRCLQENIGLLHPEHPAYPVSLRTCRGVPPVLFYRGDLSLLGERGLGLTGSRRVEGRALTLARLLGRLARRTGRPLVVGPTSPCEREACRGALDSAGLGKVVFVSAYGLEKEVPVGSRALAERVLRDGGLLLSLVAPGKGYLAGQFAARNHLLAALSEDLVVVQAGEGSGSLEAAQAMVEAGRAVWVPDFLTESSLGAGGRQLLADGAEALRQPLDLVGVDCDNLLWPTEARILVEEGALAPDELLARVPGLDLSRITQRIRQGWLVWGPGGRLELDLGPLLEACG